MISPQRNATKGYNHNYNTINVERHMEALIDGRLAREPLQMHHVTIIQ